MRNAPSRLNTYVLSIVMVHYLGVGNLILNFYIGCISFFSSVVVLKLNVVDYFPMCSREKSKFLSLTYRVLSHHPCDGGVFWGFYYPNLTHRWSMFYRFFTLFYLVGCLLLRFLSKRFDILSSK